MAIKDDNQPDETLSKTIKVSRSKGRIPKRIGSYTIQDVIASGGMGTVFKAVQENPRRAAAIKVMKAGVSTEAGLRRFEFEAQLLGRLRHPGIAQIFEAGTHDEEGTAVPFFAMEYIPNAKNIVQFAQDKDLGTHKRLELFTQVCDAVHHGHQKGIIHRDLKPGNILVGSKGNPRIIDFGVARATDSDMALTQHQTDIGQLLGTVQYMSPEQCEADPHDIDTRSDVYSLGIILYELLCGRLPYDVHQVPVFEATKVIRSQDPPRPSKINPKLHGDLETIILKSLEKDRDRRYQSAVELKQDLDRYLAGEAITARPASSIYQLRVFARKNRGFLTAATTILVVLIAGVIVSSALYFRNKNLEIKSYELEARATGANDYLTDILASIGNLWGETVPISDLLKTFSDNIDERFASQPEVEAEVRIKLAESYNFLTMFKGGREAKRFAELAKYNLNEAMRLQRGLYGADHPKTLATIEETASFLGKGFDLDRAETLRREALDIRKTSTDPDISEIMTAQRALAWVLTKKGDLGRAESLNDEALEHFQKERGGDDPSTRYSVSLMAKIRQLQGRHDEALAHRLELLESTRRLSGEGSTEERTALIAVANVYVSRGDMDKAKEVYKESVDISPAGLGIKKWLSKEIEIQATAPTLLVFWESWCPWCQLSLPNVDKMSTEDTAPLQVIGLISLSMETDESDALDFIKRNNLQFPTAIYDGKIMKDLGFTGVPMTAAVHDGSVVWKGHPDGLSTPFLEGLVRGRPGEF